MAGRAGRGQESLALMNNYLAKVKDECKPAIYSAFIRLMNAYHGNTLNVDTFLDELHVLFSPRVYLLADVKPLVDESYHQRIDELCDKVRTGGSGGGGGGGGDGLSFPPTLNVLASSPGSSNGSNINSRSAAAAAAVPAVGGGSGIKAEPRSTNPIRGGSGAGSEAEESAAGGGSSEARSGTSSLLSPPTMADATSGGGGGGGGGSSGKASAPARSNDELEGMLSLSSPSTRVLSSDLVDTTDMADLLSGIEPGVDAALLDFMMCDNDNTPVLGAAAPPAEPPTLNIQQQQPLQQQQQQAPWVFSSTFSPTIEPVIPSGNGATSGTSPTKKRRASEDCSSRMPAAAGRITAGSTDAAANSDNNSGDGRTASPPMMWSRVGSAPNLTNLSCRIQATLPGAHSRGQQQQLQSASSSTVATTSAPRPRCSVAISNGGTSKKQSATGRPPPGASVNRGGGGNLQMQQAVGGGGGVSGGSPSNSTGGSEKNSGGGSSSSSNNAMDTDDGVFNGPGKRVWGKTGGGGGGGVSGLSTPGSSSTPPTSFYFPSATAAGAASAATSSSSSTNTSGAAPCRPTARRRISTEPLPACIKDDYSSSIVRAGGGSGRRDSRPSSAGGSGGGTRFGGNSGGGSSGGGGGGGGGRRTLPPHVNLDPDSIGAKGSGFAGIGSQRSMSIKEENSARGGGVGNDSAARSRSVDYLEKLVVSVATRGMHQALQYGLRNTFFTLLRKKDQEIAELKEEALRWSANDTHLRQINRQLRNDNVQLRKAVGAAGGGSDGGGGGGGGGGRDEWGPRGPSPSASS